MYMDSEKFENWMERIMERFDRTEKLLERVLKKSNALDGEEVLDNQDLCLPVSYTHLTLPTNSRV